ncbi:MAG: YggT family protein [Patescibacteria group bacterium]|nr:YggT family protein [Patescibacteria group bacterium]
MYPSEKREVTTLYRVTRVLWYVFYALEALLGFRFVLKLFAANPGAGFTDLIYSLSAVPLAPFRLVFGSDTIGSSVFEWSTLLAMVVYWVIFWGIVKVFLMSRPVSANKAETSLQEQDNA